MTDSYVFDEIWSNYGLEDLEKGIDTLFPQMDFSLTEVLKEMLSGNIMGGLVQLMEGSIDYMSQGVGGIKNLLIWLLVLGIVSAIITHFMEIFDKHQVADLGFYFLYLLLSVVLLKCFSQIAQVAFETIESIILFIKLLIPTYLISVGIVTGTATVTAYYQLMFLLIYVVQNIFIGIALPAVQCYMLLAIVNGIWAEEKLSLLIDLLEKGIQWMLKAAVGIVTGLSIFQAVIAPAVDSVKMSTWQKVMSMIPGIGNASEGVMELMLGTASVIKNGIGVVLLVLLLAMCAAPLLEILMGAIVLKCAAAIMGIVSDKRITACTNRIGDACVLLFRVTGTALLFFLITISIVTMSTNRGI